MFSRLTLVTESLVQKVLVLRKNLKLRLGHCYLLQSDCAGVDLERIWVVEIENDVRFLTS